MYKTGFLFFLFLMLNLYSEAKDWKLNIDDTAIPKVIKIDSQSVQIKHLDSAALNNYRKDPRFNYGTENVKASLSLWDRFWRWLWHFFQNESNKKSEPQPTTVTQYLILAFAVVVLLYIIIKFMSVNLENIFNRESSSAAISIKESLTDIHKITFDEEIARALLQQNYRLAVRLLYLGILKHLNDVRLIEWEIDKTNAEYVGELKNAEQKKVFGGLTRQFEYVWYGDFPLDQQTFREISSRFKDFKEMLP